MAYIKSVNHRLTNFPVFNKLTIVASQSVVFPCFFKVSLCPFPGILMKSYAFEISSYQIWFKLASGFKIN